jgi:hypothetical protein
MKFYRYEAIQYAEHDIDGELVSPKIPNPTIELREYDILKETLKGYWIGHKEFPELSKRWVSKTSKKKFAYPTKDEALINFIKRTEKRIKILEHQIIFSKIVLQKIKSYK